MKLTTSNLTRVAQVQNGQSAKWPKHWMVKDPNVRSAKRPNCQSTESPKCLQTTETKNEPNKSQIVSHETKDGRKIGKENKVSEERGKKIKKLEKTEEKEEEKKGKGKGGMVEEKNWKKEIHKKKLKTKYSKKERETGREGESGREKEETKVDLSWKPLLL